MMLSARLRCCSWEIVGVPKSINANPHTKQPTKTTAKQTNNKGLPSDSKASAFLRTDPNASGGAMKKKRGENF